MGWFEQQIKQRRNSDQQMFEDSIFHAAGVVLGKRNAAKISDEHIITKQAIDEILKYYHYKPVEFPRSVKTHENQLDYCLRQHGLMKRQVTLEENWYRDAYGPILAYTKEENEPVALLPNKIAGYYYIDRTSGKRVKLGAKTAERFGSEAYCFYRPFPQKKLGIPDLIIYMQQCISLNDVALIVIATFMVTGVGMLMPRITRALTGPVLSSGSATILVSIEIFMLCTAISSQLIGTISNMLNTRVQTKITLGVQSALMIRVLSLPASFFRKYSSGELTSRSQSVSQLCSLLLGMILGTGLTSLMSLLYITQIFSFAPTLVIPSLIIILVTVGFSVISSVVQIGISKKQMELGAKESGMSYAMLSGIQKIKLSGSEKRFFARWLNEYSEEAELTYSPPMFIRINSVITTAISLISNIVLYYLAVSSGIDQSNYFAFTAAYGAVMGAFSSLAGIALSFGRIKPILEMAEPFLKTEPETADNKETVTKLSGSIELNNVYFRYSENSPYIVNNLSLNIKSGEYVAIVGKTGCGKSTLMRLLLGFEKPEKGAVYYDGKDLNRLDLCSLRRKIGTVIQGGGLLQGDIFSNIIISAPHLSMDEATSALDNKTQKQVSEALDKMGCTRIVIAHRLSTIRHCDRILVLDGGKVIEEGSYDELIAQNGYFAELVERQRLDK